MQKKKQTEIETQTITESIECISSEDASCRGLRQILGFGPLASAAAVAAIGNAAAFRRGRAFAAWLDAQAARMTIVLHIVEH